MSKPFSKGDQARVDILDAAQRLFLSRGYNGTSMRDIARAAGNRAVAGIYNHFPTKEAIFTALIEEQNPYDDLLGVLEPMAAEARTAPEYVARALSAVLRLMPQYYSFLQLAQIDLREFEGRNLRRVLESSVFPRVLSLIEQVERLPGMRPVEGVVWLRLMASLVIGFMITDQLVPQTLFGQVPREDWIAGFVDALLHGIAVPDAAAERDSHGLRS
jgi:AcrR family transcriptional regulator